MNKYKKVLYTARMLRKNLTKEEKHLWFDFLSVYPIPVVRQKRIGFYVIDFYCRRAKIAIEIDGEQHYQEEGKQRDIERTKRLNEEGIEVLRFTNKEIHQNFKTVCRAIDLKIREKLHIEE